MADTQRSIADVLALLADNSAGAISPQDLRDAIVTQHAAHGMLTVAAAASALVTLADTVTYVEAAAPVWTLAASPLSTNFDESGGNGRLTYIGAPTITVHIAVHVSISSVSNNRVLHLRVGLNGTTDATSEIVRKTGTGGDIGAGTLGLLVSMATGDYISLFVLNETSADDVTIEAASLVASGMPQ